MNTQITAATSVTARRVRSRSTYSSPSLTDRRYGCGSGLGDRWAGTVIAVTISASRNSTTDVHSVPNPPTSNNSSPASAGPAR